MSYRISSNSHFIRSGEELFNLKNTFAGYAELPEEEKQRREQIKKELAKKNTTPVFADPVITKSCDVKEGVARIVAFERFYTGHDDSEIVVELKAADNNTLWEWSFDDVIGSGAQIEAENLITYLEKKYACPVERSLWY